MMMVDAVWCVRDRWTVTYLEHAYSATEKNWREREYMYKSKTNLLFIQMMVYDSFLLPLTLYLSASPDDIL